LGISICHGEQDGSKRDPASSLFDEHRFHFLQARALHLPNKSDVEKSRRLGVFANILVRYH